MTVSYETALVQTVKTPVYFVKILHPEGTILQEFMTSRVRNPSTTKRHGLLMPKGVLTRYNIRDETTTIGNLDIEILDVDSRITQLIAGNKMIDNVVHLYGGFDDLNESEYVRMFVGRVKNVKVNSSNTGIVLSLYDSKDLMNTEIMTHVTARTVLDQDMGTGDTRFVYVEDVSGFSTSGYIIIDQEVMKYDNKTSGTPSFFTLWPGIGINGPTGRGALSTDRNVSHTHNTSVYELVLYEANPIDLVLYILTTTANGNNGSYDLGIDGFGVGISESEIDIDSFETIRDAFYSGALARLPICSRDVLNHEITAGLAVEDWLLSPIGCYLITTWDGKLALRVIKEKNIDQDLTPFADGNIIGSPSYDRGQRSVYNNVQYTFDWNPATEESVEIGPIQMQGGTDYFGYNTPKKSYVTRAYYTDLDASSTFYHHLRRRFAAQLEPPSVVKLRSFFSQLNIDLGDHVQFTTPHLPNLDSGGWGLSGGVQVVDKQPSFSDGTIDWTLLFLDEKKLLEENEIYVTRTPEDITAGLEADHSIGLGDDAFFTNDNYMDEANFIIAHFSFTPPSNGTNPEVILNMRFWAIGKASENYGEGIYYDFTLTYTADGQQKSFLRYFLLPRGVYMYKVDWWAHNDVTAGTTLIPSAVTWDWLRLYLLDYVEVQPSQPDSMYSVPSEGFGS